MDIKILLFLFITNLIRKDKGVNDGKISQLLLLLF